MTHDEFHDFYRMYIRDKDKIELAIWIIRLLREGELKLMIHETRNMNEELEKAYDTR